MVISIKQAADTVGMTKAGIFKAIKQGKISAAKNVHGQWEIEPSELFRVYKPVNQESGNNRGQVNSGLQHQNTGLQSEIDGLKALLSAVTDERNDLRQRLTAETDERRRLTMMLTDQRSKGWLGRLLGK